MNGILFYFNTLNNLIINTFNTILFDKIYFLIVIEN